MVHTILCFNVVLHKRRDFRQGFGRRGVRLYREEILGNIGRVVESGVGEPTIEATQPFQCSGSSKSRRILPIFKSVSGNYIE